MIVVLKPNITKAEERAVLREIKKLGYRPHVMRGVARTVIGAIGDERRHQTLETLSVWPQVESVMPVQKRYKLVSREAHPANSVIRVRDIEIGGRLVHVMAGPCSVESEKQLMLTARAVREAGATVLRGGAFKPRTSPYEFQGLGEKGVKLLAKARRETPSSFFRKPAAPLGCVVRTTRRRNAGLIAGCPLAVPEARANRAARRLVDSKDPAEMSWLSRAGPDPCSRRR